LISGNELVRLLSDPNDGLVVTPIIDAEEQIGDASIDIRLGPDIIVSRRATGATAFDPSDGEAFGEALHRRQEYVRRGIGDPFHLQPGEFVIARSLEYVVLPDDISAEALGRSSWGRLGLTIATATHVQPGFKGTITLELANAGNTAIVLEVGLCVAQLVFSRERMTVTSSGLIHKAHSVTIARVRRDPNADRRERADEWWRWREDRRPRSRYTGQVRPALSRLHRDKDLVWVAPMSIRYVVGIIGERFAGKSTVSSFLVSRRQFRLYRLSQFVYEEARRRGKDVSSKADLRRVGDAIREEYGQDAIARMAFTRIRADSLDPDRRLRPVAIVVEGFKVPEELLAFQRLSLFHTLLVESDSADRLSRAERSGELIDEMAADPLPDDGHAERLAWLERHVDNPAALPHPAGPLIDQARSDSRCIRLTNAEGNLPGLYEVLRQETVPALERWWRERDA
jgi:dCTP deaminase